MTKFSAIVASAVFAAALFAQGPNGPRGERKADALLDYLKLTDEQVTALQENNRAMREAVREIVTAARDERSGVRDELKQDNPNPTVIGQAIVDGKETMEAVKAKREEFRSTALAILTPEQQNALTALEQALALVPAAQQAVGFNLLTAPEGGMAFGPGPMMGRREGRDGPRRGPRPGPPPQ